MLDDRPVAEAQALTTPWGTVELSVHSVRLAINKQMIGEMARAGRLYRLTLPSLPTGTYQAQATATALLRGGEAEQAVTLLSPKLSLSVEAPAPASAPDKEGAKEILRRGAEKARAIAQKNMAEIRKRVGVGLF